MNKTNNSTTETTSKTFSNNCSCEAKSKYSAMFHNSKELGIRHIHSPTKLEEIDFNLQTVEINIYKQSKQFKSVIDLIKTLRDQNKFQQKLIDELRTKVNQIEGIEN